MANAIWITSAYNVPSLCLRLGLEEGTEQEAFQSKYKYAERRLARLDGEAVLKISQKLLTEEDHYKLGEVVELLSDLNKQDISELSRRNIVKLFNRNGLSTEMNEFDFLRRFLPVDEITIDTSYGSETLSDFLIRVYSSSEPVSDSTILATIGLVDGSLKQFTAFLEEVANPVCQNPTQQRNLISKIDYIIEKDNFKFHRDGSISGTPIFKIKELSKHTPSDRSISQTLKEFDPNHISARWDEALTRRTDNPEGAITLARTLLEDVCKWIIIEADGNFKEKDDLTALYKNLAKILNLAPDNHTEQLFKQILGNCQSIVISLGSIRNKLGDAHSIGPKRIKASARHAELAVNLSGTMSTFLISTWKAQNNTKT
ncbi:MAG: abortive infection family protein [Amylibacter sp.]|nr:abortive infection family protein [Amylibacter sp.]